MSEAFHVSTVGQGKKVTAAVAGSNDTNKGQIRQVSVDESARFLV